MTETEQEYFQICAWRFLHPLPKTEYGEVHHVLPKSCGGMDKVFNLVRLTPEEHYRCHSLLPKICDEKGWIEEKGKMIYAWNYVFDTHKGMKLSEEEYGQMRREFSKALSNKLKGRIPWNKGKHGIYSEETINSNRKKHLGKTPWMKGKQHSAETREKMKTRWTSEERKRKLKERVKLQWAKVKAAGKTHL